MILNTENAQAIADRIREYLGDHTFSYVAIDTTDGWLINFSTCHKLQPITIREVEDDSECKTALSFSITGFYFTVFSGDQVDISYINGVQIRTQAPDGHTIMDWLKV